MFFFVLSSNGTEESKHCGTNGVPPSCSIKLHQSMCEMVWLQYDWKARREMSAEPSTAWNRRDPWQLLSCFLGTSGMEDPFDLPTSSLAKSPVGLPNRTVGNANHVSSRTQPYPAGAGRRLNNTCRLCNRAQAGWLYEGECIFRHRCTRCGSEDHGRRTCPILPQEEAERLGQWTRAL